MPTKPDEAASPVALSGRTIAAPPKFIYFDFGKVLVHFDVDRMCRQLGDVAGTSARRAWEILYGQGLQKQYELGEVDDRGFYESFCRQTGTRPDYDALSRAGSDIFELNAGTVPLVAQLGQAGYRLGVLSNTCPSHWEYCTKRYRVIAEAFKVRTLSFEARAAKPDPAIYEAAARAASTPPEEIFFTDDIAENVAGAAAAGFDAVQYTGPAQLAADLRRRAVRFNY